MNLANLTLPGLVVDRLFSRITNISSGTASTVVGLVDFFKEV